MGAAESLSRQEYEHLARHAHLAGQLHEAVDDYRQDLYAVQGLERWCADAALVREALARLDKDRDKCLARLRELMEDVLTLGER